MKKRIMLTTAAFMLVVVLSACSGNNEVSTSAVQASAEVAPVDIKSLYDDAKEKYYSGDYDGIRSISDKMSGAFPDDPQTAEVLEWTRELYAVNKPTAEPTATPYTTIAPIATKSPEEIDKILSKLRVEKDEVRESDFYFDPSSSKYSNSNDVYVYFSRTKDSGVTNPRFRIQYSGDRWLFIEKFVINADGEVFEIAPGYSEISRDNGSGDVWEYYDVTIIKDIYDKVLKIANSNKAIIRFEGENRQYDMTVTDKQKKAMLNMLKLYREAGGSTFIFEI
ncbi:hypothetical protein [Paenibacillus sp. NPDC057934]|uniref:hypothetical protein n=1 Tax=Paenibacillus sp. NPDC057934 TaxID=3346282 RepID=UPI0036DB5DB7